MFATNLANRGFTSGLLLGLAFFAAVNGLADVISLFYQTALGLKADAAAIALSPLMAGIIIASVLCRPLIAKLGRPPAVSAWSGCCRNQPRPASTEAGQH